MTTPMIHRKGFRPTPVKLADKATVQPVHPEPTVKPQVMHWRDFPKAVYLWLKYKVAKFLVDRRNKPMDILTHPDKRLKRIAEPVDFEKTTREERMEIVRKLGASLAMQTYGARLGIAAPQIGINKRVMVVRGNVMFNPEWTPSKAPANTVTEGCYSVPKKLYKVPRAPYGWAKWTNIDGKPFEDKLKDLPAIVFQHELDHLDGKCCADVGEEIAPTVPGKTA